MKEIRQYFAQIAPMGEEDWEIFSSRLQRREVKRRTVLLKVGEVEQNLYFIEKGSARLYVPGEENDLTFGFCFEQQFLSAYDSFITQLPATYQTETLSDAILWSVSYDDLQEIYRKTAIGEHIGRITAEQLFLTKSRRELSLLHDTAEERYRRLFRERPELIREIPLKYLASYIGVTPQALSRIRRRIS